MDPLRDWVAKHQDARRPLTDEGIARDYTEVCVYCGGPTRPKDQGECIQCWKLLNLT